MSDTMIITEKVGGVSYRVTLQKVDGGEYREVSRAPIVPRRRRCRMWLCDLAVNRPLGWVKRKWDANWVRRTWVATDPVKDVARPAPTDMPTDDRLKAAGLDDAQIAMLRTAASRAERRAGSVRYGGVKGKGFAERMVGSVRYLWARSPMSR